MNHKDHRLIIPGHAVRCGLIDGFTEPAMSLLRSEITEGIPRVTLAVTWKPGAGTPPPGMRAELTQGESASLSDVGTFTLVDMEAPLDGDMSLDRSFFSNPIRASSRRLYNTLEPTACSSPTRSTMGDSHDKGVRMRHGRNEGVDRHA